MYYVEDPYYRARENYYLWVASNNFQQAWNIVQKGNNRLLLSYYIKKK